MMMSARNRNPFTATQWQELEHQALIFKYIVAGMPIPPDLIFPIKRSLDSSVTSRLFPHQPMDWGCFQMGFGRKIDPEPGRCRRTDGKKWRCSKEAYPDSKYCERHMHRGRNRSRKPVEVNTPTTNPISSFTTRTQHSTPITTNTNPSSYSLSSSLATEKHQQDHNHPYHTPLHTFLYPHSCSSSPKPHGTSFSPQNSLVLDSGSYSHSHEDHRYGDGLKEEVDERSFFSEASGTLRSVPESALNDPWRLTPLRMSSSSSHNHSKDRSFSDLQSGYSQFQLQEKQQQEQHCFVLGTDFKSEGTTKSQKEEAQQPLRHFFDEWPPKSKDGWLDLEDDRSDKASHSTTQLSISIPMSSKDFLISNSRT